MYRLQYWCGYRQSTTNDIFITVQISFLEDGQNTTYEQALKCAHFALILQHFALKLRSNCAKMQQIAGSRRVQFGRIHYALTCAQMRSDAPILRPFCAHFATWLHFSAV